MPATGFSMGVSRLYAALQQLGRASNPGSLAPVVVLVMDRERVAHYQHLTSQLRAAGIRAEMYLGAGGMKAAGAEMARQIDSRAEWREARPAQVAVPEAELVAAVRAALEQRR